MTTATATRYVPEDLLRMPDGDRYELIDGELVEKDVGAKSGFVGGNIHRLLADHSYRARDGVATPETTFMGYPDDPEKVRKPDVAYVRRERIPRSGIPEGHWPILPDLAVE